MKQRTRRIATLGLLLLLVIVAVAQPVIAAATLTTETEYGGLESDSQAVTTTVTLSPDGSRMVNVDVRIQPAANSFVDYNSFERSINPGTSDAEVEYLGDGRYQINELEPNEEITITFNAYPRTIKTGNLSVATVNVAYTQNGQNLTTSSTATADMSNSSYFAYQRSQERIEELENAQGTSSLWEWVGKGLLALIVLGIVFYGALFIYA